MTITITLTNPMALLTTGSIVVFPIHMEIQRSPAIHVGDAAIVLCGQMTNNSNR